MPPIRTLFLTTVVSIILFYGGILYVAGYESQNNLAINNTVAAAYNNIQASGIPTAGQIFGNLSGLGNQSTKISGGLKNYSENPIYVIVSSVSTVGTFLVSIPATLGAIFNFASLPLVIFGVSQPFATFIVGMLILGIIALAILSAIFLFPVIIYIPDK